MHNSNWLRSLMAANYDEEKFLVQVGEAIGEEFEDDVVILEIIKDNYMIKMDEYSIILNKKVVNKLKGPSGPYRLDKFILESFEDQGLMVNYTNSEYIKNVYGIVEDEEVSDLD